MRRFTRLINAFQEDRKPLLCDCLAFCVARDFANIYKTLRVTPAMEAGLTKDIMSSEEIGRLADQSKNLLRY